ncbi:MAG: hypothetical protein ACPGSO_07295 [Vicingaceae bacterium]
MVELTEQNISEIELLIEARGVEMKELSYDLVDHVCCMVEAKMEEGKSYTSALEESIASFGKKGIRQIQEETTFLLTKNILAMRKTMHITGITAATLLLLGSIFKIQHWPGAAAMYVLGGISLCLLFMPLFLAVRIKEKPGKISTISNVIGILGGISLCLGILFKIMHWPFASILMNAGGVLLILIFLPLYIYQGAKTKQLKTSTIVPIIIAVAGFSLMFSLVRLQSSNNVRVSRTNYHQNIKANIESVINFNNTLVADINTNTADFTKINQITFSINELSNTLNDKFIKSNFSELSDTEIKAFEKNDFENFSIKMGDLNAIRNHENDLGALLNLVEEYRTVYQQITGTTPNIIFNKNFEYYLNKKNNLFALRFVLRDINALNLQVQQIHTGLLQYYKGKVS